MDVTIINLINLTSLIISGLSLAIAIISVLRTSDKIEIMWHDQIVKGDPGDFFSSNDNSVPLSPITNMEKKLKDPKTPTNAQAGMTPQNPYLMQLTVINYGANNIGYWNLVVRTESGIEVPIETQRNLDIQGVKYVLQRVSPSRWLPIDIPEENHGLFKAHSFYEWNILVDLNGIKASKLTAEIAITKKKWFKLHRKQTYIGVPAEFDLNKSSIVIKNSDIYQQAQNSKHQNN